MENVGSQWLEAAQLKQRDSAVQMCALAALELTLSTPLRDLGWKYCWGLRSDTGHKEEPNP